MKVYQSRGQARLTKCICARPIAEASPVLVVALSARRGKLDKEWRSPSCCKMPCCACFIERAGYFNICSRKARESYSIDNPIQQFCVIFWIKYVITFTTCKCWPLIEIHIFRTCFCKRFFWIFVNVLLKGKWDYMGAPADLLNFSITISNLTSGVTSQYPRHSDKRGR